LRFSIRTSKTVKVPWKIKSAIILSNLITYMLCQLLTKFPAVVCFLTESTCRKCYCFVRWMRSCSIKIDSFRIIFISRYRDQACVKHCKYPKVWVIFTKLIEPLWKINLFVSEKTSVSSVSMSMTTVMED
jgi:hypothetical protein